MTPGRRTPAPWIALLAGLALATPAAPARGALAPFAAEGGDAASRDLRGGRNAPVAGRGGIVFRLRAPDAGDVSVVGAFNRWDEDANRMRRGRGGVWSATVDLGSGRWPYLFVVDGQWIRDPDNPVLGVPDDAEGLELGETSLVQVRRGQVVVPEPRSAHAASVRLGGGYDRVNQVALSLGVGYENRARLLPEVHLLGGYSWGRERVLYDVGVAQPLFEEGAVEIGADAYRRSATPDEFRVGATENSLAALFFREDWRDYHEAEGWDAFARVRPRDAVTLEARWRDEEHRSVAKTTDWGLFRGDKRMRANDPVDEGNLRAIAAAWTYDTRNDERNPSRGWNARTGWEWAGGPLGGDFRFQRGVADLRRYHKLSPRHEFDLRILAGLIRGARREDASTTRAGWEAIPVQERFYLGGIGTMRATRFKSLAGDRMVLGNAELRVDVFRDFQAAVFADVGDAWIDADAKLDLKTDAGIGFQDADANFRLNVAKKMDGRPGDDDVWISARIRRMF